MEVRIIKGTKQIGGCITEITVKKTKIIIDFGLELNGDDSFELEGLTKGKSIYKAVFITHYHADHIGLINKINKDIPIYVEDSNIKIYNVICDFTNTKRINRNINTFALKFNTNIEDKKERKIFENKDIKVYAYIGDHSAYNSCMFLIEGDGKRLLHTGDFRMHGRKNMIIKDSLNKIGKVDMLITEGTILSRENKICIKERELEEKIAGIMRQYKQVLVLQSSTDFDRITSFLRASIRTNKKFIIDLFSNQLQNQIYKRFINVDNKQIYLWKSMNNFNDLNGAFPYFTMEIKKSMLKDIRILYKKGLLNNACLIYSMWEGYINQDKSLYNFIEELKKMHINIVYLHTSGHGDYKAYRDLNRIVNPNETIIIHTEDGSKAYGLTNNLLLIDDNKIITVK